ncbi:hypothetical protein PR048_028084 [Dryococelus australis]|uniref:Major facilitator superfamily associated domain-containing protein n=1 Tax=Dryococelus australis TaxID=614101 RepID=A0ABQ9GI95_9NEOP|nr:hypothetical protein PR048_028084 [Dryococelus australis]
MERLDENRHKYGLIARGRPCWLSGQTARLPLRRSGFNPRPGHWNFACGNRAGRCPSFRRRSMFTSITLIGSRDLAVKSPPRSLHSLTHAVSVSVVIVTGTQVAGLQEDGGGVFPGVHPVHHGAAGRHVVHADPGRRSDRRCARAHLLCLQHLPAAAGTLHAAIQSLLGGHARAPPLHLLCLRQPLAGLGQRHHRPRAGRRRGAGDPERQHGGAAGELLRRELLPREHRRHQGRPLPGEAVQRTRAYRRQDILAVRRRRLPHRLTRRVVPRQPMRVKLGEYGAAPECNGRGKRDIPEKMRRPAAWSGTIPSCENPGATLPYNDSKDSHLSGFTLLTSTVRLMKNRNQLLIIPITIWCGMHRAFIEEEFTQAYVSCAWRISNIGTVMICYGLATAAASMLMGVLGSATVRVLAVCLATVLQIGVLFVLLYWHQLTRNLHSYTVVAGVWAVIGSVWLVQLNTLCTRLFPGDEEAAFSNYRLWDAVGFVLVSSYSNFVCMRAKLYIQMTSVVVGAVFYLVMEGAWHRDRKKTAVKISS